MNIAEKFEHLGVDNAPGQESRQKNVELDLRGGKIPGEPVDFSHGDVDAHQPVPGSLELFVEGVHTGGKQAYTEYRGKKTARDYLAKKLSEFTGAPVSPDEEIILTPGTQGALFLAMGANIMRGDKVAIVEPDYFANRKMVEFFDGELVPIQMDYLNVRGKAGLDTAGLEQAFKDGVKLFLFSNPNNPAGVIYSHEEIQTIAALAKKYDATLIVDELYSRQIFDGRDYCHLCAEAEKPDNLITIMGPSKTESLSGYRLGAAFGTAQIIGRMEKLQAIMALRCSGYNQAAFHAWFSEPKGWMQERVQAHQAIRDAITEKFLAADGITLRPTEGGSYLFVTLPDLDVTLHEFIRIARVLADVTVTPGTEFGPQFQHSFRINFSQDHKKAAAAADRLIQLVERYRKR